MQQSRNSASAFADLKFEIGQSLRFLVSRMPAGSGSVKNGFFRGGAAAEQGFCIPQKNLVLPISGKLVTEGSEMPSFRTHENMVEAHHVFLEI